MTDGDEARGLSHYLQGADIYVCSWGPYDGFGFVKPGPLAMEAIQDGIQNVSKCKLSFP